MSRIEKTVFLSYRRTDVAWALLVYRTLREQGFEVFFDYEGIGAGAFETAILENIRARAHFLLLLTPTALQRCSEPGDWLRREIEEALRTRRNIVPLLADGFSFSQPDIKVHLTGPLAVLNQYNGLELSHQYFDAAITRLQQKYLDVALDAVLHPPSATAIEVAKEQKAAADSAVAATTRPKSNPRPRSSSIVSPTAIIAACLGVGALVGVWAWPDLLRRVGSSCLEIGPMTDEQLGPVKADLQSAGVAAGDWTDTTTQAPESWLLYMGRYNSREALNLAADQLRRQGVPFKEATGIPDLSPGLVLGSFDTREAAEAALDMAGTRGARTARVVRTGPHGAEHHLKVPHLPSETKSRLLLLEATRVTSTMDARPIPRWSVCP